ncbi:MAG: glycosyltransferase family 2 protein [Ruminococcaceae bacterium]|nr:glycosyltransferase family 2 protein [Oscillospiraceae bacterium]
MISVIVPAYNIAPYIERCINSILNQTYKDVEVLLIDDGSTDETPIIADRLAEKDNRVRVFHIENKGVSNARNTALKNACGEYVSIIDGDDYVEQTLFEDAINAMIENDSDVFMFEYFVDDENGCTRHSVDESFYGVLDTEKVIQYSIDVENRFATTKIFKKELAENVFFNTDIILGEDTLFICEVLSKANKVVYTEKAYYHYVLRDGSATNSAFNRKKLSGVEAYHGVVELCEQLGYNDVAMISRKSLANLAVQLAKIILNTEDYPEKKEDLKYLRSIILKCKKELGSDSCVDKKTKIKFILTSISIKLLKLI